ncbi:MAG: hypothetical protein H6830_10685 [Planctomycetes bacterium]|nr:hypothetical protein [Planctomycetota bacterium]HPF12804.1 hypothetical protein [Planctomycetota bacterium]HRV81267.1 hypothetical protein [Planctomycetota bacterium]
MKRLLRCLLAVSWVVPCAAQGPLLLSQENVTAPASGKPNLGQHVAVGGDWCAASDSQGRVHLFHWVSGAWQLEQDLVGPGGQGFGAALALDGETLAVGMTGAPWGGAPAGAVYVYRRTPAGFWQPEQILQPNQAAPGDRFGAALALQAGRLLVGAPGQDRPGLLDAGAAYLFEQVGNQMVPAGILQASDGQPGDGFGSSVACAGDLAVVGAPWVDSSALNSGAVYVWREAAQGWTQEAKLVPLDPADQGTFGFAVATDSNLVVAGAPGGRIGGTVSGKGYVFAGGPSAWMQGNVLIPQQARPLDRFGVSVALGSTLIAVGSMGDDHALGIGAGSVTFFTETGGYWLLNQLLTPAEVSALGYLGTSLALDAGRLILGAPGQADGAGSVLMYRVRNSIGSNLCGPAQPHSGGVPAHQYAYGSAQAASDDLVLLAAPLPAASFGVFLVGTGAQSIPGYLGSQGTLCVAPPLGLFVGQAGPVAGDGILQAPITWSNLPGIGPALVGQTYFFQAWFRDQNPGTTTNFSDALSVMVL